MADDASAFVIPLHQVPLKRKSKSGAERTKVSRQRKKTPAANAAPPSAEHLIPLDFPSADAANASKADPAPTAHQTPPRRQPESAASDLASNSVTSHAVTPSRRPIAPLLLSIAALALAGVGITMNGWFARSLGSSDAAGWLFLAVGVAADLVALVTPSCAARLWRTHHRATAAAAWAVWAMTLAFAVTAGIGFASTNITDVTTARASRVTPVVMTAKAVLADAMAARDRECRGGVGRFCRERESVVNEKQTALEIAMRSVEQTADPQTQAAIHVVAWLSRGALQPSEDDFAMLRLVLLALLPQIGGILLMIGRTA
jgi:hypothetical protein